MKIYITTLQLGELERTGRAEVTSEVPESGVVVHALVQESDIEILENQVRYAQEVYKAKTEHIEAQNRMLLKAIVDNQQFIAPPTLVSEEVKRALEKEKACGKLMRSEVLILTQIMKNEFINNPVRESIRAALIALGEKA